MEEHTDIYALNDSIHELDFKSDHELKAISFLLEEGIALDITDAISKLDDVVIHQNQDMTDIAYELLHDCYDLDSVASIIVNNINYESIVQELKMNGSYYLNWRWEIGDDIFEYIG